MPATTYPAQTYPGQEFGQADAALSTGITLEVAFTANPALEYPLWTDVSSYLLAYSVKHGKQRQLGTSEAGVCTIRLDNSDRLFDPLHNPDARPIRQMRLRLTLAGTTYPLFRGYVQSWPQESQGPYAGFSTVSCVDGFLPLSKADVGEGEEWPQEYGGARISRILDNAGWPANLRDLDTGRSLIAATNIPLGSGITALAAILEVADAELGSFFIDGRGYACFHDRHRRRRSDYLTSVATFGDAYTSGFKYFDIELDTDDDSIANDIQVTAEDGNTQRAQDLGAGSSQEQYWRRTIARNVPLARSTEAADQAAWLLEQNKDPRGKLRKIVLKPRRAEAGMFAAVMAREISDHVTVNRWPQHVGSAISQHCSIESIQVDGKPGADAVGDVTATWSLSTPAPSSVDWWILGDSTYGVLGSTTKIIY
jgi:hypothetical protein